MQKIETKKCQTCKKADAEELHICPYHEALKSYDDEEYLCNCCDECEEDCHYRI